MAGVGRFRLGGHGQPVASVMRQGIVIIDQQRLDGGAGDVGDQVAVVIAESRDQAKDAAEAASQAKSEFLAGLSHELRSPLNAIIGFADMTRNEVSGPLGDPSYREWANDICDSGQHLLELINEILDHAKAEAGKLTLQEEDVDLLKAVDFCTRMLEPRAKRAGLSLSSTVAAEARFIRGDEKRLRQILLNLISNAVKYTPSGGKVDIMVDLDAFGKPGHGEVQGAPVEAAFTQDGATAYVTNYQMYGKGFSPHGGDLCEKGEVTDNGYIYELDVATGTVTDAIEAGAFPEWELGVQVFEDNEEQMFEGIDLLDPTKLVPEELAPVQPLGRMTLNANPSNYFAETEQVAFNPANLVPGIDVTNDPLLQGRLFSYLDTQLTRLGGPNWNQLPINRPHAPVNDMLRDGFHQSAVHRGVAPYRPNSLDGGLPYETPADDHAFIEHPEPLPASVKERAHAASFDDHFSQARLFFLSLSEVEREHVAQAYTFELGKCYEEAVKVRYLDVLAHVDQDLAETVADNLGLPHPAAQEVADVQPSPALSQVGKTWPIDGRQVGILISTDLDEVSAQAVGKLVDNLFAAGTTPLLVAEKGGTVSPADVRSASS